MQIIDSDNYAASGIETIFFPGGEPHVKIPRFDGQDLLLHLKLRTWDSVAFAVLLQDALYLQHARFKVFLPYFPAARQDKSDGTAPLTVRIMANLLSHTYHTYVLDPHSDVLQDKYMDFYALMPSNLRLSAISPVVGVIAPDQGAVSRAMDYKKAFHPNAVFITCTKTRDPHTGKLGNYNIPKLEVPGRYIIVDDICDGGGTFNLLADAFFKDPLARKGCQLEMFVSHGIFSRGLDAIDRRIEHITTTDSWCNPTSWDDRLTVLPLLPNFMKYLGE